MTTDTPTATRDSGSSTPVQFGIFTVGDVTTDPTTGRTPTEHERIKAMIAIALKAEEVGLDVFATGEHHNPPFVPSSPDHHARLHRRQDRAADPLHRHDADHHERPGEDRRGLRDAAAHLRRPRRPRCSAAATPARCTRGSARTSARASRWPSRTTACCTGSGARTSSTGRASSAPRCRASPPPRARWMALPPFVWHGSIRISRDRRAGRVLRRRLLREQHLLAQGALHAADRAVPAALRALRPRQRRPGHRRPRRAGVHAQELAGCRERVPPLLRQRAGVRPRPVAGGLHRADPAHRRQPAAGHRPVRWACATTSATTSASCS